MKLPSVLLAGCGDIAQRLALLLHQDYRLCGLRRHPASLPAYIEPLAVDLCDSAALSSCLSARQFDYVVITLTPGERSEQRYRQVYVDGTRNLLQVLSGKPRLLFISSTSVYGQNAGEVVDESSVTAPEGFSGRCLLEAEALVHNSGLPASCVRFSGIYGPGRERMIRLVREQKVDVADAAQWSNRIHADECARVLAFLIERWEDGFAPAACYVASDVVPSQLGEVWQWLAETMGIANPLPGDTWRQQPAHGKRCDSHLLQRAGYHFLYPDFRVGYKQLVAS